MRRVLPVELPGSVDFRAGSAGRQSRRANGTCEWALLCVHVYVREGACACVREEGRDSCCV